MLKSYEFYLYHIPSSTVFTVRNKQNIKCKVKYNAHNAFSTQSFINNLQMLGILNFISSGWIMDCFSFLHTLIPRQYHLYSIYIYLNATLENQLM